MAGGKSADPVGLEDLRAGSDVLPEEFYARSTVEVARECLGKVIVYRKTAGRIVEVEAYLGVDDRAAHSSRGITQRTRVLYGPPGHAYIYFIYGMYDCLNFVCEPDGTPGGVLIRALEPLSGLELMRRRRKGAARVEDLASGPGKLTVAMGITRALNASSLITGPLQVRALRAESEFEIQVSTRIGIRHAVEHPLRFFIAGNRFVSRARVVL
jgi:DNA-3-methyladenine glycosylase